MKGIFLWEGYLMLSCMGSLRSWNVFAHHVPYGTCWNLLERMSEDERLQYAKPESGDTNEETRFIPSWKYSGCCDHAKFGYRSRLAMETCNTTTVARNIATSASSFFFIAITHWMWCKGAGIACPLILWTMFVISLICFSVRRWGWTFSFKELCFLKELTNRSIMLPWADR